MHLTRVLLVSLLLAVLAGCDSTPSTDAGVDAGLRDAGPPVACLESVQVVNPSLDETLTLMLDTTMSATRPRDLGLSCGNPSGELRWANQEVLEVHVPGSGPVSVAFDSVFMETPTSFNTVVQVRGACTEIPADRFPPTCFDNVSQTEFRSRGAVSANGGDVLYFIVTGYSEPPAEQMTVDEGRIRLDIRVRANAAPTIDTATFLLALNDVRINVTGSDADGDARGVALNFLDSSGRLLDIYGDGTATENGDVFTVFFSPVPTGTDYVGLGEVLASNANLGGYLRTVEAAQVRIRVFDSAFATSAPLDVAIGEATLVGTGEVCDETHVCRPELACQAGVCAAPAAIATACGGATSFGVTLNDTATNVVTSTRNGAAGGAMGNFTPLDGCVNDNPDAALGSEKLYTFTIESGTFDVTASTNVPGTGMTDTIMYLRSDCADSGSQAACNDDVDAMMMDFQSAFTAMDLGPGTYTLFVETWGGAMSMSHEVSFSARPVLPGGSACDDAGVMNRCATGACTGGMCPAAPPMDGGVVDAGVDAGHDAGVDAGYDAGVDAGHDAGVDAGFDAGP